MARKYGASDLGSEWVNVPRNFRGRKSTSSPTTLAYITAPERGLLKQYALMKTGKDQVGPEGIPSYDDSGFGDSKTRKLGTYTPGSYTFGRIGRPGMPPIKSTRTLDDIRKDAQKNILAQADAEKDQAPGTPAVIAATKRRIDSDKEKYGVKDEDKGEDKDRVRDPKCEDIGKTGAWPLCKDTTVTEETVTCTKPQIKKDGVCVDPENDDDTCPSGKRYKDNGNCIERCEDTMGEEYTGRDQGGGKGCVLRDGGGDDGGDGGGGGGGGGGGSTILKPDFSFDLLALSDEMDIRNALSNVMNKNNPLFKQARTRALQAMAARGVVNSSMAEEAVMSAMLDVAMPIAERLITDLQGVMYRNQERGDLFKTQMNEMYMKELIARMEIAGNYRLQGMTESHANWRSYVEAMLGGASISSETQFDKYMDMISGMKPGSYTSASRSSGRLGL